MSARLRRVGARDPSYCRAQEPINVAHGVLAVACWAASESPRGAYVSSCHAGTVVTLIGIGNTSTFYHSLVEECVGKSDPTQREKGANTSKPKNGLSREGREREREGKRNGACWEVLVGRWVGS